MRLRVTRPARTDIAAILDWSDEHFGDAARHRYERLIARALRALTGPSAPLGSRAAPEVASGIILYHLRHSRRAADGAAVARPRHFLVYRRIEPDIIVVLRVLHDAMNLPSHLDDVEEPF